MESLRKLRSRVFSKKPSTQLTNQIVSAPKKPRDKRLRHSQSMPLHNFEQAYAQSKPVYKGKHPLKASDVQLVVDSRGCPDALVQHPAFDPVVEQTTFSFPIENLPSEDVLDLFPAPPADRPPPRRPKANAPRLYDNLYDDLLPPNPAFERQRLLSAARSQINHEPYRQLIVERSHSTSSHRPHGAIQPQAFTETTLFRDGYDGGSRTIMTHSNYSTKSLGANARLKDGPARRVVVNQPARYEPRPCMHSGASSGPLMDTTHGPPTSGRRSGHTMEPRQRQASNASASIRHGAEFGYIGQVDSHYHKTPSSASRSRPPKSSYRP